MMRVPTRLKASSEEGPVRSRLKRKLSAEEGPEESKVQGIPYPIEVFPM
jgi:predicted RNase H-like nuclease